LTVAPTAPREGGDVGPVREGDRDTIDDSGSSGTVGTMPRPAAGNLAHRTLLDQVLRHPLTVRRVEAGDVPPTIRQVQRLGEDGLAPRLRNGDPVDVVMVGHCAALLACRTSGPDSWGGLLPLRLSLDGHPMLPAYVKVGVIRFLDDYVARSRREVETLDTGGNVVEKIASYRTAARPTEDENGNVEDNKGSDRKRRPIVQDLFNGFQSNGVDGRSEDVVKGEDEGGYRTRDGAIAVLQDAMVTLNNGGRFTDPQLMSKAFEALVGFPIDPRMWAALPSRPEILEWVRDHPLDEKVMPGIKLLETFLPLFPFYRKLSHPEKLETCLLVSCLLTAMLERGRPLVTLPTLNSQRYDYRGR